MSCRKAVAVADGGADTDGDTLSLDTVVRLQWSSLWAVGRVSCGAVAVAVADGVAHTDGDTPSLFKFLHLQWSSSGYHSMEQVQSFWWKRCCCS